MNKFIIICSLLGFTISIQAQQVADRIIAKVDNYIILESELEIAWLQFKESQEGYVSNDMKCSVFETLIINKVLLAKAEIDSVVVERTMVDEQLQRRMEYFISQIGSAEKLESYYGKSIDQLKEELRPQIKEQMIVQKMQDEITGTISVTPGDVKKFYNGIPKDSLPYFSTEIEIGQIVKKPIINNSQKNATILKLNQIRDKIKNGADFCELAQKYSEDPGSAKFCGELGWFKKGELVPPYEAAAMQLQIDELSGVVESQFGFHLIQLLGRRGTEYNSRHILIKAVSANKDIETSYQFLDSIRTRILADSLAFSKAAKDLSDDQITAQSGGLFLDPMSGAGKIPMENLDPNLYFIIDTMKVGAITKPLPYKLEDGSPAVRIVYYKSKTPPHQANLKDDYNKIRLACLEEKKNNAINAWFDNAKKEVFIDINADYNSCSILQTP